MALEPLEKKEVRAKKTLEKEKRGGKKRKIGNKKIRKKGLSLRILPRRNSFDDEPLYELSSCTVQNSFLDRESKTYQSNQYYFT